MKLYKILSGQRKSLLRDPMALFLSLIPFLIFSMIKYGIPVIRPYLLKWFDIYEYNDFIKYMMYLMAPMLLGMVQGLLLMDERDMDVLSFISITPLSLKGYIFIKSITGGVIGFVLNIILAFLLKETVTLKLILFFILSSTMVPYFAISIFAFAKNKVEGLTKAKLMSVVIFAGIIPYFIKSKMVYLMFFLPAFWTERVLFSSNSYEIVISFLIGMIVTIGSILAINSRIHI